MKFQSHSDFRKQATEADMQALEKFILAQEKRSKAFPCEQYPFSYSFAVGILKEHGYLGGRAEADCRAADAPGFVISPREKGRPEFITRSFSIERDILDRIDRLSGDNWQYSKKAVVNSLLDEALGKYGY